MRFTRAQPSGARNMDDVNGALAGGGVSGGPKKPENWSENTNSVPAEALSAVKRIAEFWSRS